MTLTATGVRELLSTVRQAERAWVKKISTGDPRCAPWMPSDIAQFLVLLIEACEQAPGSRFLEVGCGPGTKMLLARDLLGLHVTGFDRVEEYVDAAAGLGLDDVTVADALDYRGYADADIVFFNRPYRDRDLQRECEAVVWRRMRRGAVVIAMNLENPPPGNRFLVITDDWQGGRRGVWMKL